MNSDFSPLLRRLLAKGLIATMMFAALSVTRALADKSMDTQAEMSITESASNYLHVSAKQMQLASVLDSLAKKMQLPIHYAGLKETLVTVDCERQSLKQLLECLLENKADLVVRYQPKPAKVANSELLSEAWVLDSSQNEGIKPGTPATANLGAKKPDFAVKPLHKSATQLDRTEELLAKAQSANPSERSAAVGALLAGGRPGDPEVKATLERALVDPNEDVRAQAISSLAHRDGDDASAAIQQALLDNSDDVRIMAVEAISDDIALLQQAINDSDESVRTLAEIKLELLAQDNNDNP